MTHLLPPALAALPRSPRALRARFAALPADDLAALAGTHRAVFVGPAVLRAAAPASIALGGMPGWYGKRLTPAGDGTLEGCNIVRRAGTLRPSLPLRAAREASWLDGRPSLVVAYGAHARPPWRWVRDEFRVLDDGVLLGLTFVATPRLRGLAMPFALVREG